MMGSLPEGNQKKNCCTISYYCTDDAHMYMYIPALSFWEQESVSYPATYMSNHNSNFLVYIYMYMYMYSVWIRNYQSSVCVESMR